MIHQSVHWLTKFGQRSTEGLQRAMLATKDLSDTIRIGEIGLEGGRFTLGTLTSALTLLREASEKPIEVYRLDFMAHNYQKMTEYLKTDPESYTSLQKVHTYFAYGALSEQVFAPESLNVIFLSHILSGVSVREPAPDTVIPSLTKSPEILLRRRQYASEELEAALERRYEELVLGGMLCLDVIGEPQDSISMFDLINQSVSLGIEQGIVPESFRNQGIRTHFRNYQEIETILEKFEGRFKIASYEHHDVPMPQYEHFLQDNDADKYAQQLCVFWKKALEFGIRSQLKDTAQIEEAIDRVFGSLKELFRQNPPKVVSGSHHFVLEKIN